MADNRGFYTQHHLLTKSSAVITSNQNIDVIIFFELYEGDLPL